MLSCGCEETDEFDPAVCTQWYPAIGSTTTVIEDYETRHVGGDTPYVLTAGTKVQVCGIWPECHDVHVLTPDEAHVWVDPDNLKREAS